MADSERCRAALGGERRLPLDVQRESVELAVDAISTPSTTRGCIVVFSAVALAPTGSARVTNHRPRASLREINFVFSPQRVLIAHEGETSKMTNMTPPNGPPATSSEPQPSIAPVNYKTARQWLQNFSRPRFINVPRILIWFAVPVFIILSLTTIGGQIINSVLVRIDQTRAVHEDQSKFTGSAKRQLQGTINLALKNKDGKIIEIPVDGAAYSGFMITAFKKLQEQKLRALAAVKQHVDLQIDPLRDETIGRIGKYCDWYYRFDTGYNIMFEALTSYAMHLTKFGEIESANQMMEHDVSGYIYKHYEEIVLWPEAMNHKIAASFDEAHRIFHDEFLASISEFEQDFQSFLRKNTPHFSSSAGSGAVPTIDWDNQQKKLQLSTHDKGDKVDFARAVTLYGSGAFVGLNIGKAIGMKLALKSAAPFVAAAVGAAAAGVVASPFFGPVGFVAGTAVALGVDYVGNIYKEATERSGFERNVHETVDLTYNEWKSKMIESIQNDVNVWFDDAIEGAKRYSN